MTTDRKNECNDSSEQSIPICYQMYVVQHCCRFVTVFGNNQKCSYGCRSFGFLAAQVRSYIPTFRDNLSVTMFKGMTPWPFMMGSTRSPETSVTTYPEEQRRQRHRVGNLKSRDVYLRFVQRHYKKCLDTQGQSVMCSVWFDVLTVE